MESFPLDLSSMPEEVALYWLQRQSGALRPDHLLVQLVRAGTLGAIGMPPPAAELRTLHTWQREIQMRAGGAINHLLIGPGMVGEGSAHSANYVSPADFNAVTNLAGVWGGI